MNSKSQDVRWLQSLSKTSGILICVTLINFVTSLIRAHLADLESRASGFSISGSPLHTIFEPLLLFVAAVFLVGNRLWLLLLSVLFCSRVIYVSSYLSWKPQTNVLEIPMFSWLAVEKLPNYYGEHIDIVVQLILASGILIYALVLLQRFIYKRRARVHVGGG